MNALQRFKLDKLLILVVLLLVALSACAGPAATPTTVPEQPSGQEEEEAEPIEEEAENGDQPCLIIGAIYVGQITDAGYNQSQHDGLMTVKENISCVEILEAENVPESAEAERVMENMIQQGAKLVFPTSFGHREPALNLAARHPDVIFEWSGQSADPVDVENFGSYFGSTQRSMYAMGVAAGLMTETNKLGYIGAIPIGFTLGNANAFHLGARSVNPEIETRIVFTGSWVDRAKEAEATNALLDQDVDVVTMHVDSPLTIIQTAEDRGAYSIGFQSLAAREFAPEGWITGLGFTWGPFMTKTAQSVIDGTWEPGHVTEGLAEGMVSVAPFGPAVTSDVQDQVMEVAGDIGTGDIEPFAGPIYDQDGELRVAEGEVLPEAELGGLDWLAEGIIGQSQ